MSIYKIITTGPQLICCSCLHQVKEGVPSSQFVKDLKSIHNQLDKETEKFIKTLERNQQKVLDKNTETLMTILSEFLQTPLPRDQEDIRKIVRDALQKNISQLGLDLKYGIEMSYSSVVTYSDTANALLKRLEKTGSDYLKCLGYDISKEERGIYESLFIFESSLNIDVVEYILKNKIDSPLPILGKLPGDSNHSMHSLYNIIYSAGAAVNKFFDKEVMEVDIYFSKPREVEASIFQNEFVEAMDKMWVTLKIPYITLMQRKLGLGKGTDFVLRLYLEEERDHITEAIRWLTMYNEVGYIRQVLIDDGRLIIKKIIK
jgi:hypothetical protein